MRFQHDCATYHKACEAMAQLSVRFGESFILRLWLSNASGQFCQVMLIIKSNTENDKFVVFEPVSI